MTDPYYSDDRITLYHGDCRMIDLPQVDLILADPPYGSTSLEWDRWPSGWPTILAPLSKQLWCFASMRMLLQHQREFAAWSYAQEVVWEKHNGSSFHNDRFRRVHEFATHWYQGAWGDLSLTPQVTMDATPRAVRRKERPAHMGVIADSTYVSEDGGPRLMRSVLKVRSMHGRAIHPTEKPTGILEPLMAYSTKPGDLVLDPFAGSGSTAAVALRLGLCAVLVEGREDYCEAIANRFSKAVAS